MINHVSLRNDAEAAASLDRAFAHFFDLYEHVAKFHPKAIRPGFDLEIDQATAHIVINYETLQLGQVMEQKPDVAEPR